MAFFGTYTLTTVDNITNGSNGLPVILSDIGHKLVIHGDGETLQRSTTFNTPEFRIFQIGAGADVTVDWSLGQMAPVTEPFDAFGGGIYNGGTLTVTNSTISGNSVATDGLGGGIFNTGTLTIWIAP